MKQVLFPSLLLAGALFLQSCTGQRLGAGLYSNNITPLHKPALPDSARIASATYLTGGLNVGQGFNGFRSDLNGSGFVQVHRGHTWRRWNLAYGGYGYGGRYRLGKRAFTVYDSLALDWVSPYAGQYGYYGYSLRVSGQFSTPTDHHLWVAWGLELAYGQEFGALTDLRQRVPENNLDSNAFLRYDNNRWVSVSDRDLFSYGVTTELNWHNVGLGRVSSIRIFTGGTGGSYDAIFDLPLNTNLTFTTQNEQTGNAWHVQLSNFPWETTIQVGLTQRLGRVRR